MIGFTVLHLADYRLVSLAAVFPPLGERCVTSKKRLRGRQDTAFETLLALNYNSFILTLAIIGVGIYSIHEAGEYNVFDSHARDKYHNSHSKGTCVLLEIPSMHKLL